MVQLFLSDGIGGACQGIQCANFITQKKEYVRIFYSARNETFKPFQYIFKDLYLIEQLEEGLAEKMADNEELFNKYSNNIESYLCWPDLLYCHKHSFNYKKYHTNPQIIKQKRLLTNKWNPQKRIIINLNSITAGYTYHSIPELVREIGKNIPDYEIIVNILTKWNNKELKRWEFNNLTNNVKIQYDIDFIEFLDLLCTAEHLITTDNGIMHIAYQIGIPMTVLDPRYKQSAFEARWRSNGYLDSLPISSLVEDIIFVVKSNIYIPQTLLIEKSELLKYKYCDLSNVLIFKY